MPKYRVWMEWKMWNYEDVEAENKEEAAMFAEDLQDGSGEYSDGSLEIYKIEVLEEREDKIARWLERVKDA